MFNLLQGLFALGGTYQLQAQAKLMLGKLRLEIKLCAMRDALPRRINRDA
jgi:hypothetical protein